MARCQWRLHAYVLMRNHFHLVLETPEPNSAAGMHWLMGAVARRFNRFRRERGHLFQGRYLALLIEDTVVMGRVVDYVAPEPCARECRVGGTDRRVSMEQPSGLCAR
ncbi:MAG: transposase, partial [Opitutaceae bacterium]